MFQNQPVCCDSTQIKEFAEKIKLAANLLANCAACWANFRTILCQQMCSPDQSTFMEVLHHNVTFSNFFVFTVHHVILQSNPADLLIYSMWFHSPLIEIVRVQVSTVTKTFETKKNNMFNELF